MASRTVPFLTILLLVAVQARAQGVVKIEQCIQKEAGSSNSLRAAIEKSIAGLDRAEFLDESSPCAHTSALLHDLGRFVDRRYFVGLKNHYFAYLLLHDDRLDVEQLQLKTEADARTAANLLSKKNLVVVTESGRTSYEFFREGALLILLAAPYRGWKPETRALAESIKKNYLAAGAR
jgi:hypothetical protein